MHVLVTGGAGFIGSNFVRFLLARSGSLRVTNLDALTYAGNLENLQGVEADPRYRFVRGDVGDLVLVERLLGGDEGPPVDAVVHFAAETHVDRSILGAGDFVRTNVGGTYALLEAVRSQRTGRLLVVSTDEVYGSLGPQGEFAEDTPLDPSSPYSATKAAADLLALSYHRTHGVPVLVTRASNNYGPYQFPEKLIPVLVCNGIEGKSLPIYGDGLNVRDWLHVEDHCAGIWAVLERGREGEVYNIGGACERTNLQVAHLVLELLGLPESRLEHIPDRPGHDRRYALSVAKIERELRWRPRRVLEEALPGVVSWYRDHRDWWERVRTGEYRDYYRRNYEERAGKW